MDITLGDPWLYMTAFGFVSSAGLLVYLVRQLNAASEDDEEAVNGDKMVDEGAPAAPAPVVITKPVVVPPKPVEAKTAAMDAVNMALSSATAAAAPAPAPAPK